LELGAVDERKKLLVVDDDRSLAAQLVMEADALGMRMDIATDLSQARDAICCAPMSWCLTLLAWASDG